MASSRQAQSSIDLWISQNMAKVAQKAQQLEQAEERQFPARDRGRFTPGNNSGVGRCKGSRNKLGEVFIQALADDFEAHGMQAIINTRLDQPGVYLRVIANLLPKDVNLNLTTFDGMTDEQLDRRLKTIRSMIEATTEDRKIEHLENAEELERIPALVSSSVTVS